LRQLWDDRTIVGMGGDSQRVGNRARFATVFCGLVISLLSMGLGSVPALAAVGGAPIAAFVALYGKPGDIAGGVTSEVFQQTSTVAISMGGSPDGIRVGIDGDGQNIQLSFDPARGSTLGVGFYDHAGPSLTQPSVRAYGVNTSASCASGEFQIRDVAFANGTITRLSLTFHQFCLYDPADLIGEISWNEPHSGPIAVEADALLFPPQYLGMANIDVPLQVTNTASVPSSVGPVTVTGSGAGDVAVTHNTCPALLSPAATCVITVMVTPQAAGERQSQVDVFPGASISITDFGLGGNAAFAVDGAFDGQVQEWNLNQFNSTIFASGTAQGVDVVVANFDIATEFDAILRPPAGKSLMVGDYPDAEWLGPDPGAPQLSLQVNGGTCGAVATGRFTISDIAFDAEGQVSRLAADAQFSCAPGAPPVFVSLRVASAVGWSAIAVTPGPSGGMFGPWMTGTTAPAQEVSVTNAGTLPLTVSPSITGTNPDDFHASSPGCNQLIPGATCSISITFAPRSEDFRRATLVIADSTARGETTVSLFGTGLAVPTFVLPTNGQLGVDTTYGFAWSTTPQVQGFYLVVGTKPGTADLVNSGILGRAKTEYPVPGLPTGMTLYVTIFTKAQGNWIFSSSISFTAKAQVATFEYPTPGMLNANPSHDIVWYPNVKSQAQGYYLVVGTSPGSANLINSGILPPTTYAYIPPPMPAGVTLYATLFTKWAGSWNYSQSITYTLQAGGATFTAPLSGQHVTAPRAPFTWSKVAPAEAYYLVVGTTSGNANLVNSGVLPATQSSYPGLALPPHATLYATVFTKIAGAWSYHQSLTFTSP
jgi:hypothetical protein